MCNLNCHGVWLNLKYMDIKLVRFLKIKSVMPFPNVKYLAGHLYDQIFRGQCAK